MNGSKVVYFPARGSQTAVSAGESPRGILSAERAIPESFSIQAMQFNLQGNDAQFDLHRKPTMPDSEKLTDAMIDAAEARTDTKIARMEGKLDLVVSKIDSINSGINSQLSGINSRLDDVRRDYRATRANIWVVGLGLAVLIVGVAALFPVFFGIGIQIRDIIDKEIQHHVK